MLKVKYFEQREQIKFLIDEFDFKNSTWLVSDLKSKYEMQGVLLEKQNFFLDTSVLRASDLWKQLFRYTHPHLKIVSSSFYKIALENFLQLHKDVLGVNEKSAATVALYINQLVSVFNHPSGDELMQEWFAENPSAAQEWKSWYLIARAAYGYLTEQKKITLSMHLPAVMQSELSFAKIWSRPLIVDLGCEVTCVEMDLLRALSRNNEVCLLVPRSEFTAQFPFLMRPYERVEKYANDTEILPSVGQKIPARFEVHRFGSQLGEVKYVIAEVRKLIEEKKVQPQQIAIMAADVETYWSALNYFCRLEGLPVSKSVVTSFQFLSSFQIWMNRIKSHLLDLRSSHLETSLYSQEDAESKIDYSQFSYLFKKIYDREDLERDEGVKHLFSLEKNEKEFISQSEFIASSLKYWSSERHTEELIEVLKDLVTTSSHSIELSFAEWFRFLETLVAQKESVIEESDRHGIQVCSMMSSQSQTVDYKFFLGLSEQQLGKKNKSLITGKEAFSLYKDYDIETSTGEESDFEWELRWSLASSSKYHYLLMPLADFSGSLQVPSNLFLELEPPPANGHPSLTIHESTRFDFLQSHFFLDHEASAIRNKSNRDSSLKNWTPIEWPWRQASLSASQLENFLKCPFIFAAEKVFRLKDIEAFDLDMSAMSKGSLVHALFETILAEPAEASEIQRLDKNEKQLDEILEKLKMRSQDSRHLSPAAWAVQKRKYVQIGLRFMGVEKEWKKAFPKTSTQFFEKDFQFYFDLHTGKITQVTDEATDEPAAAAERFLFRGKIDRIDKGEGHQYIIIDYKSSANSDQAHTQWLSKGQVQLLLYLWAIEKEALAELGPGPQVAGANYYVIKNFRRDYGMHLVDYVGQYFPETKKKTLEISQEAKAQLLENFEVLLKSQLHLIKNGEFYAKPSDVKLCKKCNWRVLCRAPHLI